MGHLAFAIDGFVDIWDLEGAHEVDTEIARAMFGALGSDVLIYRIGETQGSYFGVARLLSVSAALRQDRCALSFDRIRMFTVEPPFAAGATVLTRLQFLDEDEFAAVVSNGAPADAGRQVAEKIGQQAYEPPALGDSEMPGWDVCAFTGERLSSTPAWTVISTRHAGSGLARNVLALSPNAREAFLAGHFSARDDLGILVDAAAIDQQLLRAMNPGRRLVVPNNPTLRPSAENLADHRRLVFLGHGEEDGQSGYTVPGPDKES